MLNVIFLLDAILSKETGLKTGFTRFYEGLKNCLLGKGVKSITSYKSYKVSILHSLPQTPFLSFLCKGLPKYRTTIVELNERYHYYTSLQ